ncbi:hypothetical protein Tco_1479654 [Tanacetum coccineum]
MRPTPSPHLERGIYTQWGSAIVGFNGPGYLSWARLRITNGFKPDTSTRLAYDYEPVYPSSLLLHKLVPSCCVIFDLEPLSLYFNFIFTSEIFKSLSFSLDRLCHLVILCHDQHAHTLHLLESSLIISLDRLDILKEDLVYQSLRKSLSLILELS